MPCSLHINAKQAPPQCNPSRLNLVVGCLPAPTCRESQQVQSREPFTNIHQISLRATDVWCYTINLCQDCEHTVPKDCQQAFFKRTAPFIFYAIFTCVDVAKHTHHYCTHVVVALGLLESTVQCKPFLAVTKIQRIYTRHLNKRDWELHKGQ